MDRINTQSLHRSLNMPNACSVTVTAEASMLLLYVDSTRITCTSGTVPSALRQNSRRRPFDGQEGRSSTVCFGVSPPLRVSRFQRPGVQARDLG